mmetsp:Transcript_6854/g.17251  ORF Transcript_6854/g.17251 Transcript_6854/m.17251 type:complete len:92 (-) Transcript_6854:8-283(-)
MRDSMSYFCPPQNVVGQTRGKKQAESKHTLERQYRRRRDRMRACCGVCAECVSVTLRACVRVCMCEREGFQKNQQNNALSSEEWEGRVPLL